MADVLREITGIIHDGYVRALIEARDMEIAVVDRQIQKLELRKVEITLEYAERMKLFEGREI